MRSLVTEGYRCVSVAKMLFTPPRAFREQLDPARAASWNLHGRRQDALRGDVRSSPWRRSRTSDTHHAGVTRGVRRISSGAAQFRRPPAQFSSRRRGRTARAAPACRTRRRRTIRRPPPSSARGRSPRSAGSRRSRCSPAARRPSSTGAQALRIRLVELRSQQLLELVTKLGPTFIKIGQALSIRSTSCRRLRGGARAAAGRGAAV